ncbi:CBS domain-containing protein [Rubrivivax gelatinosus]|jgi:CBS domain-containing protein|uniref:CBS domain protein n=1 Tax=Rubrivivax gelatinosus TaxID=28068 RepID=A0A4R2M7G0_RUBGE|nr:CBS domain-containing protein [Rubrivivax gelatinosus]MBK1687037.1 histidine kinase [Rubrivivax gelatinosus]TCP02220.1 CBS domain protein [Rubrivivax gelatinosus]
MKPVSEVLRRRQGTLWHVHPDDSVYAALELLAAHEIGALLVMDGGCLVGVVSERDYTRKVALQGRNSRETRVAEIMTREVVRVPPEAPMHECMALMSEHRIRHLPVLSGATVLGMISMRDLLDELIAEQERTIAELEHYIHS